VFTPYDPVFEWTSHPMAEDFSGVSGPFCKEGKWGKGRESTWHFHKAGSTQSVHSIRTWICFHSLVWSFVLCTGPKFKPQCMYLRFWKKGGKI
jgi:hypothetical protein